MMPTFRRGRLTSLTDAAGNTEYSDNSLGQLLRETRTNSGMASLATVYGYDPANADLDSITYPSGLVVSYGRDSNGRIATILADSAPLIGSISYMPFGPAEDYDMMAGGAVMLHVDRTFNERYLPTLIQAGTVMDYQYKYYADGSVWQISGVPTTTVNQEVTDSYQVSGSNRLDYSVTEVNPPVQYGYDANGNTISDGSRTFTYDRHNRLISISQGTETLAEYAYDFQGRRVKKTVGGMTTCYVYDADNNLIAEIAGDGTPLRDYIYLGSEPVAMKVYGAQAGIYYFLNDHPGTPQKIVDSTGTMVWEAAYLPFGQAQMLVATITNNLRFPGQYFDAETGLHYNWHRYYDPSAGRYLTPDPIGLDGGINLYAYANNNPVNWIDPSGLFVEGLYNSATGQLNLVDLDTGNSVAILAESGGKPFGAPIPPGTYDILDRQGRLGFYRLDRRDATPYNDIDDTSGRDHFRLHRPGRTTGCVAAKDDQGWKAADDLIRNTPSTDFVPDNFKPWWKIWPTRPEYIRRFGTLTVH